MQLLQGASMNSNNSNKFKIGSLIVEKDPTDDLFRNDIGIILDNFDNWYKIHWFRYYDYDGPIINHIEEVDFDTMTYYKVLA